MPKAIDALKSLSIGEKLAANARNAALLLLSLNSISGCQKELTEEEKIQQQQKETREGEVSELVAEKKNRFVFDTNCFESERVIRHLRESLEAHGIADQIDLSGSAGFYCDLVGTDNDLSVAIKDNKILYLTTDKDLESN